MRKVKNTAQAQDAQGRQFRKRLKQWGGWFGVKNDVPLLMAAREAVAQSWPQKRGPRPRKRPSGPEDILQTERGP